MISGAATKESIKVQISKVIRAKRQRVFDAWTKPETIQQWFGPKRMTMATASTDLRVGGGYRIELRGAECADGQSGSVSVATGVYREIVPNELLSFTWKGNWEPVEETLVTVKFKDVEDGTEVVLIHERFSTAESAEGHKHGWTESLDKLAVFCEA